MIKRKLKKFTSMALVIAMTLCIAGCEKTTKTNSTKEEEGKTEISVMESATETDSVDESLAIAEQEDFSVYLDESFEEAVTSDTITFHNALVHPENYGVSMDEVTLGEFDLSEEALAEDKKMLEEDIKELEGFDYELLTEDQQLTYDILHKWLETELLSYDNPYFFEPFAYNSGLQTNFPITMANYAFYDEEDVKDYITLLNQSPDYYQKCLDFEKTKSEKGLFMKDSNADEVIRQCEDFISDPENNLLIATFNDRIGDVPGMTPEKIEDYKKQNYDAVMNSVIPAYENVIDTFTSLKGTGTNEMGLAHYEGGKEYYEYLLKSVVGTDKTPEEIIAMLDVEIESAKENDERARNGEYPGVTFEQSPADENGNVWICFYCDSTINEMDDITDELLYSPEEAVEIISEMCLEKFPEGPDVNYTILNVHESLEDSVSPAYFMVPPLDGYENNYIYINGDTLPFWHILGHEGMPGHMYQFTYYLASEPEPMRYMINPMGYIEGWATYAELLSYGYYDEYSGEIGYTDYLRDVSRADLMLFARIDIGVNYEGWSYEEAIEYMESHECQDVFLEFAYDYVIAEPANYQMYVTGLLEMEELKTYAQDALGDKFDEVEFHKAILDAGPCQFSILKKEVEEYINEKNNSN